ncbi:zinc ribbon domain-containing protein [Flavisolibacter ginsengisoli]|jgi:RNA polymerase subunit RPABC4/transcription elongation factor Spt4|uniref:Double zinc ribbon n=1 Tax=Flavisolibacter ginsengisoli DSM 18119 TaxID=1121884 RepID=A0A1M5EN09_9BACT|nr:zinc ribbon domain-containing protein [Flavisolibacter ginsengisoli]SHF80491.1 Double zinc ribbon [Flavisolibacter ginsengisoli DSM 18119]
MVNEANVSLSDMTHNESTKCYNCNAENSGKAKFCKSCGSQLICKNCSTILVEESTFCSSCGIAIKTNNYENRAVNQIEYTQKGNSKSFVGKFTDEVGSYFANAFNTVISGHPIAPRNPFQKALTLPAKGQTYTTTNNKEGFTNIQDAEYVIEDYSEIIAKIFKETETGKLELVDNRLKERSKNDKIKRLTILFVYANKLKGVEVVTREDLNELMKREKLNLDHFRTFIGKEALKYISAKENGTYSLLTPGEEYAHQILNQIVDIDFKPVQAKSGRKPARKSSDTGTGKENKSGASLNPSAFEMCNILIKDGYFNQKRKVNEVVEYCSQKKAQKYSAQLLHIALSRLIKDGVLDREKNSDNQYEYWKK